MTTIPSSIIADLAKLDITPTAAQGELLARYLDLLLETNRKFNLTAVRDRDEAWGRHIVDSLTLLPFVAMLPPGAAVIDVGTGGGLPGIALAIMRNDLRVTLLEATGKKARFCQQCAADLPLDNVRVMHSRAETAGRDRAHRQRYDAAVCRAIGAMNVLLECCLPLVRVDGRVLAMKGPKAEAELQAAGHALDILGAAEVEVRDAYTDGFDQNTVIVAITKHAATPKTYPRPPGMPAQSPL